jgi:hypothetical protein
VRAHPAALRALDRAVKERSVGEARADQRMNVKVMVHETEEGGFWAEVTALQC